MKKIALCLAFLGALGATQGIAATGAAATKTASPAQTAQQSRMKDCAAQYHQKGIAKSQYKTFMSACLKNPAEAPGVGSAAAPSAAQPAVASSIPSATTVSTAGNSQTEKMKSCNADAKSKNLGGVSRKDYMKSCLSNK